MILRKIWHLVPKKIREALSDKTGVQAKYLRWNTRLKSKRLRKLKGTEKGKRCFIVGNGPSLTVDDLEMLKDEDTFACNYIFKIFDKTNWRPTYYTIQDYRYLELMGWKPDNSVLGCKKIKAIIENGAALKNRKESRLDSREYVFYCNGDGAYEGNVKFSDDISLNIYEGATVTYSNIQIAAYMGYSEIYLIGVDCNYPAWDAGGSANDSSNYMEGLGGQALGQVNPPDYIISELAYKLALKKCNERGISIYNATRGGKLEVFPRVNLDEVLAKG